MDVSDAEIEQLVEGYHANVPLLVCILAVWGVFFWLALRMAKQSCSAHPEAERLRAAHPEWNGIGGWLWIPSCLMVMEFLAGLLYFLVVSIVVLDLNVWTYFLADYTPREQAALERAKILLLIYLAWHASFLPVALVQFFRKKAVAPAMVIVYKLYRLLMVVCMKGVLWVTFGGELAHVLAGIGVSIFLGMVSPVIWVAYFTRSKRVKIVFNQ